MKSLVAALLMPCVAAAQTPPVAWTGAYYCAQGVTAVTLTVQPTGQGNKANALFHFKADKSNPGVPEGCFAMSGTFDSQQMQFKATDWLLHPAGYVSVDVLGHITPDGQFVSGVVTGPGCGFLSLRRAKRDPDEARCHRAIS